MRTQSNLLESMESRLLMSTVVAVPGGPFALGGTPYYAYPDGTNNICASYFGRKDVADANGNQLSMWVDPATGKMVVQLFRQDGTPRSQPFPTAVSVADKVVLMENIAISGDGKSFVMVWMAKNTQNPAKTAYLDNGQLFSISTPSPSTTGFDSTIAAKSTFAIAPKSTVQIYYPYAAMDYAGNFVVAWEAGGTGDYIHAQQYSNTGALLGKEISGFSTQSGLHNNMAIAMNRTKGVSGNFVVVWDVKGYDNPDGSCGMYGQVFRNGLPVSKSAIPFNQTTVGDQVMSTVAMGPDGGFIGAWVGPDSDGTGEWIRRFDASGTPLGNEVLVNKYLDGTEQPGNQGRGRVAIGANGDFLVSWETGDFSGAGKATVSAQAFAKDGTRIGDIQTVGTNDGLYLDVVALPAQPTDPAGTTDEFAIILGDHTAPSPSGTGTTFGYKYDILA